MSQPLNMMNTRISPISYSSNDYSIHHEAGIQKIKKQTSTGGGRAWSEEEEAYLLQTRMQKMPYKHIAAHLKKTELACRLHYHQLSHGSNRRKRTDSFTSTSTDSRSHSPTIGTGAPSYNHEIDQRSVSPSNYAYSPASSHVQLPAASTLLSRSVSHSPVRMLNQPITILPKPSASRMFPETTPSQRLHLSCTPFSDHASSYSVDNERLQRIYETHRASFWESVALEYGPGPSPAVLEETWRQNVTFRAPPTPCTSPEAQSNSASKHASYLPSPAPRSSSMTQEAKINATSISSLLGIDANPRSASEREFIKRMELQRDARDYVMA